MLFIFLKFIFDQNIVRKDLKEVVLFQWTFFKNYVRGGQKPWFLTKTHAIRDPKKQKPQPEVFYKKRCS